MAVALLNYGPLLVLQRSSIFVGIVLLASAMGCQRSASRAGLEQLNLAHQQYDGGRYNLAIQSTTAFLRREGRCREAGEAYYLRGLAYRQLGTGESGANREERDRKAHRDFLDAIDHSKDVYIQSLAHVALGHMRFENTPAEPQKAIDHYRKALEHLKEPAVRDVVLYRLGVALQRNGQWDQANDTYSTLMADYPTSAFTARAREHFGATCWRMQWGAFSQLSAAQMLIVDLQRQNIEADWQAATVDQKLLYKVRSGRYNTYRLAEQAAAAARLIEPQLMLVPAS